MDLNRIINKEGLVRSELITLIIRIRMNCIRGSMKLF